LNVPTAQAAPPSAQVPAVRIAGVTKNFRRETGEAVRALDHVSCDLACGQLTCLAGPDGAGKTTLIRLIAGLFAADSGTVSVMGIDAAADPAQVQARVAYMPQRFGLYEDLSVAENLALYADLHGVGAAERERRFAGLMEMTGLGDFTRRLAGKLSGGMKQKLGLACTLISSPELLLLDEPTVGVDPLSRRELWQIIGELVGHGLTVLVSTSYLDEAERCERVLVLHDGRVLAWAPPQQVTAHAQGLAYLATPVAGTRARDLQSRLLGAPGVIDAVPQGGRVRLVAVDTGGLSGLLQGAPLEAVPARFEDGFMLLMYQDRRTGSEVPDSGFDRAPDPAPPTAAQAPSGEEVPPPEVEVRNLVRRFGRFTAVDNVSFTVRRGEIFGLLGPNGAGKTTTFRMLCGLMPPSGGSLTVAGIDARSAGAAARQHLGYMAQKFSLYGDLSVRENLEFFASAYGLHGERRRQRLHEAMRQVGLEGKENLAAARLPGGYKQRLAMAAALLHEPEILFLDEPTSGADPLARREFWQRITALAARGVTVIVTTHFMEEAEYCDRAVIMDGGRMLAEGTPERLRAHGRSADNPAPTMDDAFVAVVAASRPPLPQTKVPESYGQAPSMPRNALRARMRRTWALTRKESRQIFRDPSSIAIGIVLPLILILLFGYGLSLDVQRVPLAVVQQDPSLEASALRADFALSRYFAVVVPGSSADAGRLMAERKVDGVLTIPQDFSRRWRAGTGQVQLLVNGINANNARIVEGYAAGPLGQWQAEYGGNAGGPVVVAERLWFNDARDSHFFLVPGLVVLVMTIIGAFLTALVVAREWERGTLEALFVTPMRLSELMASKLIPYFGLGMVGFALCMFSAEFLFHVPIKGSLLLLCGSSMLYLLVSLGIGLLVSIRVKSQFLASQMALLLSFLPAVMLSGLVYDLRSMPPFVRAVTAVVPARYAIALMQTLFLAGNIWSVIGPSLAVLAIMAAGVLLAARRSLRKGL
jgi:ABC-2 type transport system permease protein